MSELTVAYAWLSRCDQHGEGRQEMAVVEEEEV